MEIMSEIFTFAIEITVALILILLACFEETIALNIKVGLVSLGILSLIPSMITLIGLFYKEK